MASAAHAAIKPIDRDIVDLPLASAAATAVITFETGEQWGYTVQNLPPAWGFIRANAERCLGHEFAGETCIRRMDTA